MNNIGSILSSIRLLLLVGTPVILPAQPVTAWHDSIISLSAKLDTEDCLSLNKAVFYNGKYIPIAIGGYIYQVSTGDSDTVSFLYYYGHLKVPATDFERMRSSLFGSDKIDCYYVFPFDITNEHFLTKRIIFEQSMQQLNDLIYGNNNLLLLNSYLSITTIGDSYRVESSDYGSACWYYHIPVKNKTRIKKRLDRKYWNQLKKGGAHYFKIW